jgi:hypothetical protein
MQSRSSIGVVNALPIEGESLLTAGRLRDIIFLGAVLAMPCAPSGPMAPSSSYGAMLRCRGADRPTTVPWRRQGKVFQNVTKCLWARPLRGLSRRHAQSFTGSMETQATQLRQEKFRRSNMSSKVANLRSKLSSDSKIQPGAQAKPSIQASKGTASKSQAEEGQDSKSRPDVDAGRRYMRELGTDDHDFFVGLTRQIVATSSDGKNCDETNLNFDFAFVRGLKPQDQVESALALQMAGTHRLIMGCTRRLLSATTPQEIEIYGNLLIKLNRTYLDQMEALKAYRRSKQEVTVQNTVSVRDGGQAIVTQHGRAVSEGTPAAPLAITDAKVASMPNVSEYDRVPEPVAARRDCVE